MAESDPIGYEDLVTPGTIQAFIDDLEKVDNVILKIKEHIGAGLINSKSSLGGGSPGSVKEADEINKTTQKINEQAKAYEKISSVHKQLTSDIAKAKIEQQAFNKLTKDQQEAINENVGAYQRLSAQYRLASQEAKNLAIEFGADSEQAKKVAESANLLRDKLQKAEQSVGQFQREVGNYHGALLKYGKGLSGFGGLVRLAGEAFGVNTEAIERAGGAIREAGKALKEYEHAQEAAKIATEGEVVATEAATGGIGLLVTGIIAAIGAIALYIENTIEMNDAEEERAKAIDGTIIKNEELRKSYNEHIKAVQELQIDYAVLNGVLTETEAKIQKINITASNEKSLISNETNAQIKETTSLLSRLKDALIFSTNSQGMFETSGEKLAKILKENDDKLKAADTKANDDKAKIQAERDQKVVDEMLQKNDEEIKAEKEKNKKKIQEHKKTLEIIKFSTEDSLLEANRQEQKEIDDDIEKDKKKTEKAKKDLEGAAKEQKEFWDSIDKMRRDAAESEKKRKEKQREQDIKDIKEFTDLVEKEYEKQTQLKIDQIDKQMSLGEKEIDRQQDLAARGLDNRLAFEKSSQAKLELQRQQLAKQEIKRQKEIAYFKALTAFLETASKNGEDPASAAGKALAEMVIADVIAGSFAKGVENFKGKGTGTSDSNLIRFSDGESVATARATSETPGLISAMNEDGFLGARNWFMDNALPDIPLREIAPVINLNPLLERLDRVESAINNKPVQTWDVTGYNEITERKIENGMTKVIRHVNNKSKI